MLKALLLFVILAAFFGITYYLNSKTPVPKGCEKLTENCEGCKILDCANRKEVSK